jgi:hypothetical protein
VSKLLRQLRREAKRNPKKAGILGLLALVAVWFWAPLLMDWFRADGQKAVAASHDDRADSRAARGQPAPGGGPQQPSNKVAALSWQELIRLQDQNPRAQPSRLPETGRDPFVTPSSQLFPPLPMVPKEEPEKEPKEKPDVTVPDLTPQELGLSLSSTIVGPRGGLAMVNGNAYKPSEIIVVQHNSQRVEFQLTEIHPRRIVLIRNGKSYSLEIPRPDGTGQVELVGGNQ